MAIDCRSDEYLPILNRRKAQLMSENVAGFERVINVLDINPRHRHRIVFQLFEHLAAGNSLQLVVDHEPKSLRFQLEAKHGSRCQWTCLEDGPDVWRVRLRQTPRPDTGNA